MPISLADSGQVKHSSIHTILGGGKVADVILWRNKRVSTMIMIGITSIWLLLEVIKYNLVTLLSHIFITTMLLVFIWSSGAQTFKCKPSTETFAIRLTGKNYAAWEFQFRMFLKGKALWNHIDGSSSAPTDDKELTQWETKDACIISWILASVEPHMVNNLCSFSTAKQIWDYLRRIYHQENTDRRFQLELEISKFSQGNLSIEQYYFAFINLWSEYSGIIYSKVSQETLEGLQAVHEKSKRDQFLMKLRPEFETVRAGLLNTDPVPSLDVCVAELMREEQRMATQAVINGSKETGDLVTLAYAPQGRNRGKEQSQCYKCGEFGHIARNCSKKFCNYCKQQGHIIKECPTRPENRKAQAFQAVISSSTVNDGTSMTTNANQSTLTPSMVQQMILIASSALGLQGSCVGEGDREGT